MAIDKKKIRVQLKNIWTLTYTLTYYINNMPQLVSKTLKKNLYIR